MTLTVVLCCDKELKFSQTHKKLIFETIPRAENSPSVVWLLKLGSVSFLISFSSVVSQLLRILRNFKTLTPNSY